MVTPRSVETWPSSGGSWPVIIRNKVVLPDPLGPTRPIFSPFWSAAEASMKRIWWPFCLLTLSRRIICAGTRKRILRRPYATGSPKGKTFRTPHRRYELSGRFGRGIAAALGAAAPVLEGEGYCKQRARLESLGVRSCLVGRALRRA